MLLDYQEKQELEVLTVFPHSLRSYINTNRNGVAYSSDKNIIFLKKLNQKRSYIQSLNLEQIAHENKKICGYNVTYYLDSFILLIIKNF